jgi:hypothetical protein
MPAFVSIGHKQANTIPSSKKNKRKHAVSFDRHLHCLASRNFAVIIAMPAKGETTKETNTSIIDGFQHARVVLLDKTKEKPLISQGLLVLSGWCRTVVWWRWWESNTKPRQTPLLN